MKQHSACSCRNFLLPPPGINFHTLQWSSFRLCRTFSGSAEALKPLSGCPKRGKQPYSAPWRPFRGTGGASLSRWPVVLPDLPPPGFQTVGSGTDSSLGSREDRQTPPWAMEKAPVKSKNGKCLNRIKMMPWVPSLP